MAYERLRADLIRDEGIRFKAYLDCCGKFWRACECETKGDLTIGVGHNLDKLGISELVAMMLLSEDIERVVQDVQKLAWFPSLSVPRQDAVMNMLFNLGLTRFLGFKKMIKALIEGNFDEAANQALLSRWASQVKARAVRIANVFKSGFYIDSR